MNKKLYQSPTMEVIRVKAQQLLCGSPNDIQTNELKQDSQEYEF